MVLSGFGISKVPEHWVGLNTFHTFCFFEEEDAEDEEEESRRNKN